MLASTDARKLQQRSGAPTPNTIQQSNTNPGLAATLDFFFWFGFAAAHLTPSLFLITASIYSTTQQQSWIGSDLCSAVAAWAVLEEALTAQYVPP